MKQKYIITSSEHDNALVIQEYAELDKGVFSLLYEETFDANTLMNVSEQGKPALVQALRTQSFYPIGPCADELVNGVREYLNAMEKEPVEIMFNDIEALGQENQEDESEHAVELDEILDDELDEENLLADSDIKNISSQASSSLKVAEDDDMVNDDDA